MLGLLLCVCTADPWTEYFGAQGIASLAGFNRSGCLYFEEQCWTYCFTCTGTPLTGAVWLPWEHALKRMDNSYSSLGNPCWCRINKTCGGEGAHEKCERFKNEPCVDECRDDNWQRLMASLERLCEFSFSVLIYPIAMIAAWYQCCCRGDKPSSRIQELERRIRRLQEDKSALEERIDELSQSFDRRVQDLEEELEEKKRDIGALEERIQDLQVS